MYAIRSYYDSKIVGCDFSDNMTKNTTYLETSLQYSNFFNTTLDNIKLDNCDLSSSDFNEAKIKNLVLDKCIFDRCKLFKTSFKNVDFSGSRIDGISLSRDLQELRGVV